MFDFPVCPEPVNNAELGLPVLTVSISDSTYELSAFSNSPIVYDLEPSVLSVSVSEPNYELSAVQFPWICLSLNCLSQPKFCLGTFNHACHEPRN